MSDPKTLRHHAELVDRMAGTLGIDLQESAIGGQVSVDEISDAVLRCSDCPNPGHCARFLSENQHSPITPEYCRNQELFERLNP